MGLDMYLERHRYVKNWGHMGPAERTKVTLIRGGKEVVLTNPACIVEEIAYWRKANAIHKWFCDLDGGKDECQEIYVPNEKLTELVALCEEVIAHPERGPEKLPAQSGFFFGGTDYDDWYIHGLEETVRQIKPLLTQPDVECFDGYYYQASW